MSITRTVSRISGRSPVRDKEPLFHPCRLRSLNGGCDGCPSVALRESLAAPKCGRLLRPRGREAYPTGTSTCVISTSLWVRRETSIGSATSKNSVKAPMRFARASSIEDPWLAISSSGQSATRLHLPSIQPTAGPPTQARPAACRLQCGRSLPTSSNRRSPRNHPACRPHMRASRRDASECPPRRVQS